MTVELASPMALSDKTCPPLITIMVPIYNHAAYVEECLDSIRDEDWPRLELVLLDDGSKDHSFALTQAWVRKNCSRFERIWLETQANQGLCKTLNRLVKAAHGDYLVLIASDDSLAVGGIRRRFEYLQQNPGRLAVFGLVNIIGDNQGKIARARSSQKQNLLFWRQPSILVRWLILNWGLAGPILMCRRQVFDPKNGIGLYDETLAVEDLEMYLRLLSQNALGFVEYVVGNYRIPEKRIFHFAPPKDENFRVWKKHRNSFQGMNHYLVILQMWKSERAFLQRPTWRYWIGRQVISLFKKYLWLQILVRSSVSVPKFLRKN